MAGDSKNPQRSRDWVSFGIEMTAGLAMTSVGIVMTLGQAGAPTAAFATLAGGTILTTVGSILLSWTLSKLVAVETATRAIRERLKPINLNIGQHLGSIRNIVKLNWSEGDISGIKRQLRESAENIRLQVGHVQSLIGQHYDTSETDETFGKLDQQQERLAEAVKDGDTRAIEEANREIAKSVEDLRKTFGAKSLVSLSCPRCGTENPGLISDAPNSSAHLRCTNCQLHFPIHRNAQGMLFIGKVTPDAPKPPVAPSVPAHAPESPPVPAVSNPPQLHIVEATEPRTLSVVCPECGNQISYRARGTESRLVVCLQCKTGLTAEAGGAVRTEGPFAEHRVETIFRAGKRRYGQCPKCDEAFPLLMKRADRRLGFCLKDHVILWGEEPGGLEASNA